MKKVVDGLTVLMLAAAFIFAYHTGFVRTNENGDPALTTGMLAIISIAGSVILFAVGTVSTAVTRRSAGIFTKSFLGLFIAQALGVIGMITIMLFLLLGMYDVSNEVIRLLYIAFAMIGVIGYADSIIFSDSISAPEEENAAADSDCEEIGEAEEAFESEAEE